MVQIDLAALNRPPSRQSRQMVTRGVRIARSAGTPWAARSGHLRGVYGVKAHRFAVMTAADCIAVVVFGTRADE